MTKVLDIELSITAANGNAKLAKDLFNMLLEDLNTRLEQINTSFNGNDMDALAEHIHKLYGATAYCIVPRLRSQTEILEHNLKAKDFSNLQQLVENVTSEITELMTQGPLHLEKDW